MGGSERKLLTVEATASFQALAPDESSVSSGGAPGVGECERVAAAPLPAGQMGFTGAHPKRILDRH